MDPATLYVLVFCTKMLSCYPVDGSGFDMTKVDCEAMIENRVHKDGQLARVALSCLSEEEWARRYPERPERGIGPIAQRAADDATIGPA
jgi:hypothetical protein